MADRRVRSADSSRFRALILLFAAIFVVFVLGVIWVAAHLGSALAGLPTPPADPFELPVALAEGEAIWPTEATVVAAVCGGIVVALFLGIAVLFGRRRRSAKRPDHAAQHMAKRSEIAHLTRKGAAAKAVRLGVDPQSSPGVSLGKALPSHTPIFSSWEDMIVVVAGPRTMKSTAFAIPGIMSAPGAVLATSNKRDVVDATRLPRSEVGRVWVFDPQGVANEPTRWWWNPLTYIAPYDPQTGRAVRDVATGWVDADESRAEKLAGQFCASSTLADAKRDAYFDGEAENLIALLLLAAACSDRPITTVYEWLSRPAEESPVGALRDNGFDQHARSLLALILLPEKQRDGVYGTARARMGFLRNRRMVRWMVPADGVEQFHPSEFAISTDTLYPLSKEGEGSAGPLVAALTVAVIDALEEAATRSPGGRLSIPFVAILDEAANICRFRNLDSYYSHFGSRGIIIETILQNWAQGEEVWGVKGMEKLWSAANVKVYGGGVDDDRFLKRMSDLIGTHTYWNVSESVSSGGGRGGGRGVSVSTSSQERTILTVGELRELPQGRAILFASGTPAVLLEPVPWFVSDLAPRVAASLDAFSPKTEAEQEPPAPAVLTFNDSSQSPWNVGAIKSD